jgi:MFS family permease
MVMILLYQAFPIEERGWATSVMGIPLMVAPAFGPVLGGYLMISLGWPWAFFINVPLGMVAVAIALQVLRRDPPAGAARFDLAGFVTIAGGSAALLYGIAMLPNGADPLVGAAILLAGLGLLATGALLELRRARRGRTPLLDLRRLRDATFTLSTLALMLYTSAFFGVLFLVPVYLQTVHRESAAVAGLIQGAIAVAALVAGPVAGHLSDRSGPKSISLAGVGAATVAVTLMTTLTADAPLFAVAAILALLGLGSACTGQMQVAAMSRIASEEHQEVANGATLVSVLRATAAPLGVTLLSVIVQARSPGHVASLAARGLPGALTRREGTLLAMHDGFGVAAALTSVAIVLVVCVPARRRPAVQVRQRRDDGALTGAGHVRADAAHGHIEIP